MRSWAKLLVISACVAGLILIINELAYKGPSMDTFPPKSPIGVPSFKASTDLFLPNFSTPLPFEKTKKVLPPLFAPSKKKPKGPPTSETNPTKSGSKRGNSGGSSGGGSSGGGSSGGGSSGGGSSGGGSSGGGSSGSNAYGSPSQPPFSQEEISSEYPKTRPDFWLEQSVYPEFSGSRHNSTCERFLSVEGKACGPKDGRPCPNCGG